MKITQTPPQATTAARTITQNELAQIMQEICEEVMWSSPLITGVSAGKLAAIRRREGAHLSGDELFEVIRTYPGLEERYGWLLGDVKVLPGTDNPHGDVLVIRA